MRKIFFITQKFYFEFLTNKILNFSLELLLARYGHIELLFVYNQAKSNTLGVSDTVFT